MKQGTLVFPSVDLKNGRKLTLAVEVDEIFLPNYEPKQGMKLFGAQFGYSLKNPLDQENPELANTIARGRAHNRPFVTITVESKGVSKNTLTALAKVLQDEFENRLENYITTSKKKQPRETEVRSN